MASFYGTIDLMKIKGAKVLSGLDEKHPNMNYVCIPIVNYSGVELRKGDDNNYRASLPVNLWPLPESYRQKVLASRASRGEDVTNFNPPSHSAEVNYPEDFRKKAQEAARKRILTEHPDWKDNPEHEQELKNAVFNAVKIKLGNIYAHVAQPQQPLYQQQPVMPQATGWQPPVVDANGNADPLGLPVDDDDLPF